MAPEMERNAKQTSNFRAAGPTRQLPPQIRQALKKYKRYQIITARPTDTAFEAGGYGAQGCRFP